jgi:hypothetical protein
MLTIYDDIFIKMSEELTDREKIYLSMTSKQLNMLKYEFIYKQMIHVYKIFKTPYFDNFECVQVSKISTKYPKAAKQIYLRAYTPHFPPFITHLRYESNRPIFNIPQSITHLTFFENFDQPIDNCIPSSVTHLTFGTGFDRSIKNDIPSSVTHLTFGLHFNQPIKNYIPCSVTHLKFGFFFQQSINELHHSIEEIILYYNYNTYIHEDFRSKIKYDRI